MDILIAVFVFIVGFLNIVIGFLKHNQNTAQSYVFIGLGAFIFIMLAILMLIDPIQVVSGFNSTQTTIDTTTTTTNTSYSYTSIDSNTNMTLGIMFALLGIFLLLFIGISAIG